MKSYTPSKSDQQSSWIVIDASKYVLGRLATKVAHILRGKNKPVFTPHMDMGDYVIVINADKVKVTGKKREQKVYYSHSGYLGGIKQIIFKDLLVKDSTEIIRKAVFGMLPKNVLGRQIRTKLKVYSGVEHPHTAQQPGELV